MKKDDAQIRFRMPADLKDFIQGRAQENQRSMNGEIVYALRQYQRAHEKGA